MFAFGLPADPVAWSALCLSFLCLFLPAFWKKSKKAHRLLLFILAGGASLLSVGYFYFYLGGAPRIIDATAYLLEARTFSQGDFSFAVPEPSASFRGRFLIHTAKDSLALAPIFPPGYPALLALATKIDLTFFLGPLFAAALVFGTYQLAFSIRERRIDGLTAAALSVLSVSLRYHTAETMSHGLSALLTVYSLLATVRLIQAIDVTRSALLLGLCLGWLLATRQLTGGLIAISCAGVLLLSPPFRFKSPNWPLVALGMVPGLALLMAHQFAITGEVLGSSQLRYYSFADGPQGCFGLGLGKGCGYEHADVVAQQGGQGLSLRWALLNTLHRLHWHSLDIANFEPLVILGLIFGWKMRRQLPVTALLAPLFILPLGYSLFYFNGSYPGGGARFFSELIPAWHVLIALGLVRLGAVRIGLFASLLGFALHGSFAHRILASPHFGPPSAEVLSLPDLLRETSAELKPSDFPEVDWSRKPLIFFSSAHSFNLAHGASETFTAARRTHDDRERLLWARLERPPVFAFHVTKGHAQLEALHLALPQKRDVLRIESEFDYPPIEKEGLWLHPEYVPHSCASRSRALALHQEESEASFSLELPALIPGRHQVKAHILLADGRCRSLDWGMHDLPLSLKVPAAWWGEASHIDRIELTPSHH